MNKTYKKIKVKNKSLKNKINFVTNFIFENNNKFYNGLYKKDKNLKDSFIHLLLYNKNLSKKELIIKYKEIIKSFTNKKSEEFIKIYFGNNAINTTELCKILPIYDI